MVANAHLLQPDHGERLPPGIKQFGRLVERVVPGNEPEVLMRTRYPRRVAGGYTSGA